MRADQTDDAIRLMRISYPLRIQDSRIVRTFVCYSFYLP